MNLLNKPWNSLLGTRNGKWNKDSNGLRINTWNIRSPFKPGAMKTITDQVQKYKLPLVALQELRWTGNGNIKSENYTIFYSGSENSKHEYGLGFMISDLILPNVKDFTPVSDRLCVLKLKGRFWYIVVINCYAYAIAMLLLYDIKCEFYEELKRIYDTLPKNCVEILMGDFNVKIGHESLLDLL